MYQKVYFYSLCSLFLKYPYLMHTKKCIFLYFCHLSSKMAAVSTHEFDSSKDIFQNRSSIPVSVKCNVRYISLCQIQISMSSPVKCNVRYISLCQNRTTCLYMWCNIDISLCDNQTSSPYLWQCKIELEYHLYAKSTRSFMTEHFCFPGNPTYARNLC